MKAKCSLLLRVSIGLVALSLPFSARADNLLSNGSLEDLGGNFANQLDNYMALFAGSTAISGWTVSLSTVNEIAWGKSPTSDGFNAADGTYFVDLTGFGSDSPNGALQQTLNNLIIGQQYQFSMDSFTDGALPLVTVGSVPVPLSPGVPFTVGTTIWTPELGTFIANGSNPLLVVMNQQAGQTIDFVDNFVVTGSPTSAVPEPASFALFTIGLASLRLIRRRKCT